MRPRERDDVVPPDLRPEGERQDVQNHAAVGGRRAASRKSRDVERVDGRLRIVAGAVPPQEVNRALVTAGIGVTELRPERTSLEDVFFELTREEETQ